MGNNAIIVRTDGTWSVIDMPDDTDGAVWFLEWAYATIGGGCDIVEDHVLSSGLILLVDEEGIRREQPRNEPLMWFASSLGFPPAPWRGAGLFVWDQAPRIVGIPDVVLDDIRAVVSGIDVTET